MNLNKFANAYLYQSSLYAIASNNDKLKIDLGDPDVVGNYISDIILFILRRISPKNRPKSIRSLRKKIYALNEFELSSKKMPSSASIGSAITFVKHVLMNRPAYYIRKILNGIVKALALKVNF